jgi:hypothetical protein
LLAWAVTYLSKQVYKICHRSLQMRLIGTGDIQHKRTELTRRS